MSGSRVVANAGELLEAASADAAVIEVRGAVSGMPMITLRPGVTLRGGTLEFGAKGVRLTSGNTLQDVAIRTPRTRSRCSMTHPLLMSQR